MIIKRVTLQEGIYKKDIEFNPGTNLIFSDFNSTGKTTLLRFILFGLGYSVPSTKKIDFDKCNVLVTLETPNDELTLTRDANYIEMISGKLGKQGFVLPSEQNKLHKLIFDIEDDNLINNLLGVFYVDQEKGWTLLNRGIVIGKIRFNIEQFILALSNRNSVELFEKLKALEKEIKKYRQMFNIAEYQSTLKVIGNDSLYETKKDEDIRELSIIESEIQVLETELSRVGKVLQENKSFIAYVENMKILVKSKNDEIIPVNKDTIQGYLSSNEYLVTRKKIITAKLYSLKNKYEELNQIHENEMQFDKIENMIESFDKKILSIKVDQLTIQKALNRLEKEKKEVNAEIKELTRVNNDVLQNIYNTIFKYAIELNFVQSINLNNDFIFTDDLKSLSGTILHKIVFSFRLAYINELKIRTGLILPIILDSPSGREITKENIDLMIDILRRDFSEHQIIIASIFEYNSLGKVNKIVIKDKLIDELI